MRFKRFRLAAEFCCDWMKKGWVKEKAVERNVRREGIFVWGFDVVKDDWVNTFLIRSRLDGLPVMQNVDFLVLWWCQKAIKLINCM